MPHPVAGHCLIALNNEEVMSIGGIDANGWSLNETWIYNINNDTWRPGKQMSHSRYYHGCSWISDSRDHRFIIVAGGTVGEYRKRYQYYYWSDQYEYYWYDNTTYHDHDCYDQSDYYWYDNTTDHYHDCYDQYDFDWYDNTTLTETVEVYDPITNTWLEVNPLPEALSGSQLIEDGKGGVLMIGGDNVGTFSEYRGRGDVSDIYYLSGKDGTWKKSFKVIDIPRQFHVAMLIPDSFVKC